MSIYYTICNHAIHAAIEATTEGTNRNSLRNMERWFVYKGGRERERQERKKGRHDKIGIVTIVCVSVWCLLQYTRVLRCSCELILTEEKMVVDITGFCLSSKVLYSALSCLIFVRSF